MTTQQLIESVLQVLDVGAAQALIEINEVYKDFCTRSEVLRSTYNETIVADTYKYTLASNVLAIKDIRYYNSDSTLLTGSDTLNWDIDNTSVTFYDCYNNSITEIPDSITTITYDFIKIPASLSLSTLTTEPEIPSDFHGALIDGTLARLHPRIASLQVLMPDKSIRLEKDFKAAAYHRGLYEEAIKKARKYHKKDSTSYNIAYHDI